MKVQITTTIANTSQ